MKNISGPENYPVVLTIAGSDSGGGAGVQADLKTFAANAVYGTSAITCITAQNPDGVNAIYEIPANIVEAQILAVTDYFSVKCIKTGMLFSEEIILRVSEILKNRNFKLIIDPVMVSTSGAKLLQDSAIDVLVKYLFPLADLITPNIDEASVFLNEKISDASRMKDAAFDLYSRFKIPVLLKGGHLKEAEFATDILFDGKILTEFSKPFLTGFNSHGTGCTFASAIAAGLGKELGLKESVFLAKEYLQKAIQQSVSTGKGSALNHFPVLEPIAKINL